MKFNPLALLTRPSIKKLEIENKRKDLELQERKLALVESAHRQAQEYERKQRLESDNQEIKPPHLPTGVVPDGEKSPIAMDACPNLYSYVTPADPSFFPSFLGYPQLALLSQSSDYRSVIETTATEMTRAWGSFVYENDGDENEYRDELTQALHDKATAELQSIAQDKLDKLEDAFFSSKIQTLVREAIEKELTFGRSQIHVDFGDEKDDVPLILSAKSIKKSGKLPKLAVIEPMWSTPSVYNANDPTAPDFFKPTQWFVMGKKVHADRLYTMIMREVADILKPAYNFGGVSMVQLMKPYVQRYQRSADSISEIIRSFSLTILSTDMSSILADGDSDASLTLRAGMFNKHRDNSGIMLLDKEREGISQINTPLNGLSDLLKQSLEQMAGPSHTPLVKLLGVTPGGLNASSEGEIRVYYDYIMAQCEAHVRPLIDWISKIYQLALFGEIDESIQWRFNPLHQMNEKELAEIDKTRSETLANLVNGYLVSDQEARRVLASYEDSDFSFINIGNSPDKPDVDMMNISGFMP